LSRLRFTVLSVTLSRAPPSPTLRRPGGDATLLATGPGLAAQRTPKARFLDAVARSRYTPRREPRGHRTILVLAESPQARRRSLDPAPVYAYSGGGVRPVRRATDTPPRGTT